MSKIRAQYHLRKTATGIDAWKVERLVRLTRDLPVQLIDPGRIAELHENHWYFHDPRLLPSPQSIIEHYKLIRDCDLDYPIILDMQGRVMDGMHRVCRAIIDHVPKIPAVRFATDPEPDITNCRPEDFVYDA